MASTQSSNSHDAEQIANEAAALALHLQSHGVRWLPKPNEDAAERFSDCFRTEPEEQTAPSPAGTSGADTSTTGESTTGQADSAVTAAAPATSVDTSADANTPTNAPAIAASTNPPSRLSPVASAAGASGPYPGDSSSESDRVVQLQTLESEVAACTRCEILSQCRTKTVFGEGSAQPRVVFFGEGPGAEEDRTGKPFVGKAGQLLTKMIEACKLRRDTVYIMNTVKCRPPGNRNPESDELDNCRDFYERQLNLLRPEYIICLGAVSAQELLKSKLSVGRLRGKFHSHYASKVLVTYHPAYLLRNPAAKKAAWEDLQIMMRDAGLR